MFVRTLFGARIVAFASLAAVIVLARCSSAASYEHPAANPAAGAPQAMPVAKTTAMPLIARSATAAPVLANIPSST